MLKDLVTGLIGDTEIYAGNSEATPTTFGSAQAVFLTEPGDTSAISINDIHQGGIGDCFLLAAIGELASFHPDIIRQIIVDNGNGTATVTLFGDINGSAAGYGTSAFAATKQTVSTDFPSFAANGGSWDTVNGQKEIWVQVLEKAFAQLYGGYSAIQNGGNPFIVFETLTGQAANWESPSAMTAVSLAQHIASGDLLTFDTGSSPAFGLVGGHSYMLEGLQTVDGVVNARFGNPWGYNQPPLIPIGQLSSAFTEVDIGHIAAVAPAPVVPVSSPTPIPAPVAPMLVSNIVLHVSEDAWMGDAQFIVTLDDVQVGGVQTATASHAAGQAQSFTIAGPSAGPHRVGVQFINDAWGGPGTNGMDRNLYVDGISVGGAEQSGVKKPLYSNGAASFDTPGSNSSITLNLSEDAWLGDAQIRLTMDGSDVAGLITIKASHLLGQEQQLTFMRPLTLGTHDLAITFTNDAWGGPGTTGMDRNAYLDSIDIGGQHFTPNIAQYSNGTTHYSISPVSTNSGTATLTLDHGSVQPLGVLLPALS